MALTTVDGGMLSATNAQYTMFKNRLINGAMTINQRAFTSSTTATTYPYDQWTFEKVNSTGTFTCVTSTDAPSGFTNSIQLTTTTGMSSVGASEFVQIGNYIEGLSMYDFQWGGSSAVPVVLSFWFKASQTGTYAASIANSDGSYVFAGTFTVIASGVWEFKTIPITGATAGTWQTNTNMGLGLRIGLGYGSTYTTGVTNNAWKAGSGYAGLLPSTTNNSLTTTGAYVKLAGVQLEKGLTATAFDYRPYTTELGLCQRYYWQQGPYTSGAGDGLNYVFCSGAVWTNAYHGYIQHPVVMRTTPTLVSTAASTFQFHVAGVANGVLTNMSVSYATTNGARITGSTVYAGTQGLACQIGCANSSTTYMGFFAQLV